MYRPSMTELTRDPDLTIIQLIKLVGALHVWIYALYLLLSYKAVRSAAQRRHLVKVTI